MIFILAIQTAIADDTAVTEETPAAPPQVAVASSAEQPPDVTPHTPPMVNILADIQDVVPIQVVTFDADRLNRLGFGDDISEFRDRRRRYEGEAELHPA